MVSAARTEETTQRRRSCPIRPAGFALSTCLVNESLEARPDAEETSIDKIERPKDRWKPCDLTKRSQQGNRAPHRGKCRSSGDDRVPTFLRVEAGEQFGPIERAYRISAVDIFEMDCAPSIQPFEQGDFPPAERTGSVKPYGQRRACLLQSISLLRRGRGPAGA